MTVVAGYIPTPEGMAAVEAAATIAGRQQLRLVVVNTGHHGDNAHAVFADAADLDALDRQLGAQGIEHEVRQPASGRAAAEEILGAAVEADAELIVIGIRRRSPVGKLLTGSTAQQVLLDADCPVLAVKPSRTPAYGEPAEGEAATGEPADAQPVDLNPS